MLSEVDTPEIQDPSDIIDSSDSKDQPMAVPPTISRSSPTPDSHATSQVTIDENVRPSNVSIPELKDAAKPDVEFDWDNRAAWIVCADGILERRILCWIIVSSPLLQLTFFSFLMQNH